MTNSIVKPPTKEVLALCDDSDLLIERYLACVGKIRRTIRFEAETETYTILKLILRHLESVCELARHDLVLLPSAIVLSRAAFEASVRLTARAERQSRTRPANLVPFDASSNYSNWGQIDRTTTW
jgi:hypothetical protein